MEIFKAIKFKRFLKKIEALLLVKLNNSGYHQYGGFNYMNGFS